MRTPIRSVPGPTLAYRDAFADAAAVESRLVREQGSVSAPAVSIGIPTYKRPDLLLETVQSCLAQRFERPIEIVIVDNDPDSVAADVLMSSLSVPTTVSIRYFVNSTNIGPFSNWNRSIALSRAPWGMVLNDDDLLVPDCLQVAFQQIDRDPSIDGIVLRKTYFDERSAPPASQSFARRQAARLLWAYVFGGSMTRRIRPGHHYFYTPLGNTAGFVFRKSAAEAVGGFYPEEYPSSDYWFYARFADRFHLRQHYSIGARIRISNDQVTRKTLLDQLRQAQLMRTCLEGSSVPGWYRHIGPYVAARQLAGYRRYMGFEGTDGDLEQTLGFRLPHDRKYLLTAVRLLLRGF